MYIPMKYTCFLNAFLAVLYDYLVLMSITADITLFLGS